MTVIEAMQEAHTERREASFVIPIYQGKIMLAERRTPPYAGFYSAIGGKNESAPEYKRIAPVHHITKPNGLKIRSLVETVAEQERREAPGETAFISICRFT